MACDVDQTICAIATAPGGAVRGIVRVSGADSMAIVARIVDQCGREQLAAADVPCCLPARVALGEPLGDVPAVIYLWPTARSYTRQPSVELHLPGSPPLLEAALAALCRAGARLAQPGEFTLRAFLAGRLDLTQAEAVLGVIDATSREQLDVALTQLAGGLARPLHALRDELLDLLAHLEAGLDFVEEDIEFIRPDQLHTQLATAAQRVKRLLEQMTGRGRSDRLPRVVLVGEPNVGKSSLLNALAGDAAAIVSDQAGTTRDFVTRTVRMGAYEVLMADTAGRGRAAAAAPLEAAAHAATQRQAEQADVVVECRDATCGGGFQQASSRWAGMPEPALVVLTKWDLVASASAEIPQGAIATSSRTGQGLDDLRTAIACELDRQTMEAATVQGTADRCRESLRLAGDALKRAWAVALGRQGDELVAAEIRLALEELGRVVGAIYTDDILDRVFSRFCIGK